nr:asparagine synthase (glutamine-hydrolyzing) [uncultured Butyricicoccus sp.]
MCGIAGTIDLTRDVRDLSGLSARMADTLTRRGPDAGGSYEDSHALLVHRRLIVVDPAGGGQPMYSPDGNIVLVYNGELYNTEDIRRELCALGHCFQGHSDTEVVLHAYLAWGTAAFAKFNGIYAFALWDKAACRLTLCRDRMGVKPLFYARRGDMLTFGSEIKAIFCHPDIRPQLDEDGLRSLLLLGPARPPESGVFRGIHSVRPGQYVVFDRDGLHYHAYWKLTAAAHPDNLEQTVEHTRWLIEDAAKRQLVSDVPLCTFLSGGLDSSILSMLAARELHARGETLHTFSVDYRDNDKYFTKSIFQPNSDSSYIDGMAEFIGSHHHKILLEQKDLADALLPATDARDLPGMADVDSSLLLFCQAVKEGFTVCQSGECADELFGGYPWYHREEILFEDCFPWSRSTALRQSLLHDGVIRDGEEFVRAHYRCTCQSAPKLDTDSPKEARMREMFVLNLQWFMATLLDRKDRMSMYSGLEVRVPFCDHRIVEYAYNMPWAFKSFEGREKGIVRKAFEHDLPEEIVWRKKSPYPKTFSPVYTQLVADALRQRLNDPESILPQWFRPDALLELMEHPNDLPEPWYGQLMRTPQIFAYLLQIDHWFRTYRVELI